MTQGAHRRRRGRSQAPPRVIVLMGVAGAGKSTIGRRLAVALDWPFRDADTFHPPENVAKMSRGEALDDDDRAPWLAAIAAWVDAHRAAGTTAIVSCSALRRRYRHALIGDRGDVALVYLKGSIAVIGERMSRRKGHFMPASLLTSQFATLEEPAYDERPVVVSVTLPPKRVVERIIATLDLTPVRRVVPL